MSTFLAPVRARTTPQVTIRNPSRVPLDPKTAINLIDLDRFRMTDLAVVERVSELRRKAREAFLTFEHKEGSRLVHDK